MQERQLEKNEKRGESHFSFFAKNNKKAPPKRKSFCCEQFCQAEEKPCAPSSKGARSESIHMRKRRNLQIRRTVFGPAKRENLFYAPTPHSYAIWQRGYVGAIFIYLEGIVSYVQDA